MRPRRPLLGALAAGSVLGLVSPPADAGPIATDGTHRLQLEVDVQPARASPPNRPRPVALRFATTLTTVTGDRPQANLDNIQIQLPRGMRFDSRALPQCRESAFFPGLDRPLNPAACPRRSIVGSGTAVADGRPAIPQPVTVPARIFNAVVEYDVNLQRIPPRPGLLVYAAPVDTYFVVEIDGSRLTVPLGTPPAGQQAPVTLTGLRVRVPRRRGQDGSPFVRAPRACRRSWAFSETYSLAGNPLTARDTVRCRPA